ncbi:MAG: protein translocase subunit SecF [Actinomycetia bacterium]|nr:protein translocase subunit SecF [Actinomycetes bacterium]
MARLHIDFMGKRNIFFAISGVLVLASVLAVAFIGLKFGVEFQGGTVMTFQTPPGVTVEEVRDALVQADVANAQNATIQPTDNNGFIVRTAEKDVAVAEQEMAKVASTLGVKSQDVNVTTIGAGWGANVTRAAIIALVISILAILLYVSLRFEYKMSVTAVLALVHDTMIVLGVYVLAGREMTPNTVAALLTIIGYSLYDTIVVFHRIRENTMAVGKRTFMDMANESINQVFIRWVNTAMTQIIPVLCLLFFGGETLRDFAFAMTVGLISGAYSSIFLASPLYAVWKETEPRYQALKKKYASAKVS